MGWTFEYLSEDLMDNLRERFTEGADIEIGDKIAYLVEYGDGLPVAGNHQGEIKVNGEKHIVRFVIKRRMPEDGIDYGAYERQYEVIVNSVLPIKSWKKYNSK